MPIFDSISQLFAFLGVVREEKKKGAEAVGVFGSRRRGDHKIGKSDVDVMVTQEGVSNYGEYEFGGEEGINVVRTPPVVEGEKPNDVELRKMREETRWVWSRKK